ncbi:toxic anion resistance protein [Peribacillus psychrosaccharolyticus]|uniref:toxic anion resistance protein n=1 Tax=Peribacillus psychrosaccharolyticus TaxID=1407 RepID=UPI003D270F32
MKNEDEYYRQVELLAGQLDLTKPRIVMSYGVNIQAKMLPFTRQMLEQIQSKKVNQTGEVIKGLMRLISELGQDEGMKNQSFLRRVFKKNDSLTRQLVSYQKASAAVEQARVKLDRNKNFLLADTLLLNRLFTQNNELHHELNVYLTAGELKRQELIRPLPEQEHIEDEFVKRQEAEQRHHIVEVLDKRLYDLRVSIEITKQNSVLIKLIQGTNERLIEKIQSSILTSIPLWRNQVALTMANLQNQEIISAAEKNNIEQQNKKVLETQKQLLKGMREVIDIQQDSHTKRTQAEKELSSFMLEENEM